MTQNHSNRRVSIDDATPQDWSNSIPAGSLNRPQPAPVKTVHPAVWSLVIADMAERDTIGAGKYGTRLQPFNGRDPMRDAYQEVLDLAVYLRQAIYERDQQKAGV